MKKRMLLGLVVLGMSAALCGCSKSEAPEAAPGTPLKSGAAKGGAQGTAAPEPMKPPDGADLKFGTKTGGR